MEGKGAIQNLNKAYERKHNKSKTPPGMAAAEYSKEISSATATYRQLSEMIASLIPGLGGDDAIQDQVLREIVERRPKDFPRAMIDMFKAKLELGKRIEDATEELKQMMEKKQ